MGLHRTGPCLASQSVEGGAGLQDVVGGFRTCAAWTFCIRCDDSAKSSGRWFPGSPPSAVVWQLAPRAWCPLRCLLSKTVGVLSSGVGRSEECAQEFAPHSHIHGGLNKYRQEQFGDIFHFSVSTREKEIVCTSPPMTTSIKSTTI